MSRIFTDQIQKPSGTAFTLPVSNAASGKFVQTDGQGNLSFENPTVFQPAESWLVAPESSYNVGTVSSHTDRSNIYSTGEWGGSSSWTTYTNYQIHTDNSAIQFWNMLLGDGQSNQNVTSEYMQGGDSEDELPRRVQFASGNRVGYMRDVMHWDNVQGNPGHTLRVLPIRNTNSGSVSVNITGYVSNYWSSGNEGGVLASFVPNAGKYSAVTTVTGTSMANVTSSNNTMYKELTGSVTIPANTTALIALTSTDCYQTTYRFKDTNYFSKLNETFTGSNGVICDMRMLSHLVRGRPILTYAGGFASLLPQLWTTCATQWGDR
jgi:hypothetical protein